jgi:hypothetical protein
MIKTTIIAAAIGAALVVGYLLGKRRAVRECAPRRSPAGSVSSHARPGPAVAARC